MASTPTTPTPASTPAAPAAAPSAAPTSAPAVTPAASPAAAPTTPDLSQPLEPRPGETQQQIIKRAIETRAPAAAKAKAEADATAPAVEAPAAEPPTPEAAPAEPKKEGEEAPADAAAEGVEIPEDELSENPLQLLTPKTMAEAIENDAALKTALEANPSLRNELFRSLRIGAEASKVVEVFPTESAATFARAQTLQFNAMRERLMSAGYETDPAKRAEGMNEFLGMIAEDSILMDEETGKPLLDAAGNPRTDGTLEALVTHTLQTSLDAMEAEAKGSENAELLAAVQLVKDAALKGSSSPSDEELPEHLKAQKADLDNRENQLRLQQTSAAREKRTQMEGQLQQQSKTELDTAIDKLLARYEGLPDYTKTKAKEDLRVAVLEQLSKDDYYKAQRDYLITQPQTAEVKKQRVELYRGAFRSLLPMVFRPIMQQAGAGVLEGNATRKAKSAEQIRQSKAEPKGGSAAPIPAPQQTSGDALQTWEADFKKEHNGKAPSTLERTQFLVKRQQAAMAGGVR